MLVLLGSVLLAVSYRRFKRRTAAATGGQGNTQSANFLTAAIVIEGSSWISSRSVLTRRNGSYRSRSDPAEVESTSATSESGSDSRTDAG